MLNRNKKIGTIFKLCKTFLQIPTERKSSQIEKTFVKVFGESKLILELQKSYLRNSPKLLIVHVVLPTALVQFVEHYHQFDFEKVPYEV